MSLLEWWLDGWFDREDLTPPGSDTQYLRRWVLFRGRRRRAVYLHKIVASDWARDPHDHPKDFLSIGLRGTYIEEVWEPDMQTGGLRDRLVMWSSPWIRCFDATTIHRLILMRGAAPCWTLVFTGREVRDWGFWDTENGTRTLYADYLGREQDR